MNVVEGVAQAADPVPGDLQAALTKISNASPGAHQSDQSREAVKQ